MNTPSRNTNLGIIGMGFVGSAVFEKFKSLFNILTSKIKKIYSSAYSENIIFETSLVQAELIKYYTNCFLAFKVSFANEMFELFNKMKINYNDVLDYVILDKRIEKAHLSVSSHDGDIGYGVHCLPKDLSALTDTINFLGSTNNVLKSIKKTNDKLRKNKDWEKIKGRAVL